MARKRDSKGRFLSGGSSGSSKSRGGKTTTKPRLGILVGGSVGPLSALADPAFGGSALASERPLQEFGFRMAENYTGFNPRTGAFLDARARDQVFKTYGSLGIGWIASTLASKLGINRKLGQAGAPVLL